MDKPTPKTLGELKQSGYASRSIRSELRENMLKALRAKEALFPGIVGYDQTVIPELVNAVLSQHDFILLGLRGQAKTRILRGLTQLLDPWIPFVAGSEINDDPLSPSSAYAKDLILEKGDDTPIDWLHRESRYQEKLATPDVTIADLIGDIDPVKAATQRLSFSSLEAIHYGLVPRANRSIFAINELPDLQPRIQVGLLSIMQEKDIQIRGFPIRLPLDLCMVFSANPEDYTNRGSIITPLKDRIDSQIITHYPKELDMASQITDQESWTDRRSSIQTDIPEYLREAIERIAFEARESEYVDQTSGVSARLPIGALECVVSNLERRAALTGEKAVVARVTDLMAAIPAITGKVELVYEGEQEGPLKVARYLIGKAIKTAFEDRMPQVHPERKRKAEEVPEPTSPYQPIMEWFRGGKTLDLTDSMNTEEHYKALAEVTGLEALAREHIGGANPSQLGPAMEFVVEGLHQSSVLAKEEVEGRRVFMDMFQTMFSGMDKA